MLSFDLGYEQRQPISSIQPIFIIPEKYRPDVILTKLWITTDGSVPMAYFWRIMPDGTVTLQSITDVSGKTAWMVDYFTWMI